MTVWGLVHVAVAERGFIKTSIEELPDLTDESDNSHDWGFYLYASVVSKTKSPEFTIYYSDGFEIITSWFPGFLLRNCVSLSLLARNACEAGISATSVRNMILSDSLPESVVPKCVYEKRELIKAFLNVFKS